MSTGVSLALVSGALAYKKQITAADQASAKHDLLTRSDLSSTVNWKGGEIKPDDSSLSCSGYHPKSSDLIATGDAESKFTSPGLVIDDSAAILATARMVATDAERTFTPRFMPCLRTTIARGLGGKGRILSVGPLALRRVAPIFYAYRLIYQTTVNGHPVKVAIDTIAIGRNRTELTLNVIATLPTNAASGEADLTALDRFGVAILARRGLGCSSVTACSRP